MTQHKLCGHLAAMSCTCVVMTAPQTTPASDKATLADRIDQSRRRLRHAADRIARQQFFAVFSERRDQ